MAVSRDSRVEGKELEKNAKYKDLQIEAKWLWQEKTEIASIVLGSLGAIPKYLEQQLNTIIIDKIIIRQLQNYLEQFTFCDDTFNIIKQQHLPVFGEGLDRWVKKCQILSKHMVDSEWTIIINSKEKGSNINVIIN